MLRLYLENRINDGDDVLFYHGILHDLFPCLFCDVEVRGDGGGGEVDYHEVGLFQYEESFSLLLAEYWLETLAKIILTSCEAGVLSSQSSNPVIILSNEGILLV